MRVICRIGSPRALQGLRALLQLAWTHFDRLISALEHLLGRAIGDGNAAGQGYRILIALFSSENSFEDIIAPSCFESLASNGAFLH